MRIPREWIGPASPTNPFEGRVIDVIADTPPADRPTGPATARQTFLDALPLDEWHPINRDIVNEHLDAIEAEAVAAFIRDDLPGLLAEALHEAVPHWQRHERTFEQHREGHEEDAAALIAAIRAAMEAKAAEYGETGPANSERSGPTAEGERPAEGRSEGMIP